MVADTNELLNESNMVRPLRAPDHSQPGLFGCLMTLAIVAFKAGANQVFPGILAAVDFGNDMVDRHLGFLSAAILAPAAITLDNILAGQHDPLGRNLDVKIEPDHGWHGNPGRLGTQYLPIRSFDNFGLFQIQHYHSAPDAADRNGLEILI